VNVEEKKTCSWGIINFFITSARILLVEDLISLLKLSKQSSLFSLSSIVATRGKASFNFSLISFSILKMYSLMIVIISVWSCCPLYVYRLYCIHQLLKLVLTGFYDTVHFLYKLQQTFKLIFVFSPLREVYYHVFFFKKN
jgi:hypothetical protein